MRFTLNDIKQRKKDGKIRDFNVINPVPQPNGVNGKRVVKHFKKKSPEKDWIEWNLLYWCNEHAVSLKEEFKFAKTKDALLRLGKSSRNFKADWAIESMKILIEYEGLFSEKSGHTTAKGYTKDTDKYNLAAQLGYTVFRFTALNYKTLLKVLNEHIEKKSLR